MGALSTVIYPDTLRSIDSSTFTGSYQTVGTPLAQSSRVIKFTNNSNKDVTVSWDGTTDHDFIPSNSFVLVDVSGARENAQFFEIQKGTQFYVKGAAGTGLFYISAYFGRT